MLIKKILSGILLSSALLSTSLLADVFSKAMFTWPAGIIPYKLNSNLDADHVMKIQNGMRYYNTLTNVTFVKVTSANKSKYPHYVEFQESPLIDASVLYNLCEIGSPYGIGIRYARIPDFGQMSSLETQHCLARVIGLHDEIKRSDRNDYIAVNEAQWKKESGDILYIFAQLNAGSYGYGKIANNKSYNYGPYNYRGILAFNDITEPAIYRADSPAIATIHEEAGIPDESYFDEMNEAFMKGNSQDTSVMENLNGPYFVLHSNGRIHTHEDPFAFAEKLFTAAFMQDFYSIHANLSSDEKIALLQKELHKIVGYDIRLLSKSAYAEQGMIESGQSLLVIAQGEKRVYFKFFDENGVSTNYSYKNCAATYFSNFLNKINWDDTPLSVMTKANIFNDALSFTHYQHNRLANLLDADLIWFNQQTVNAINSVYLGKANTSALPWDYQVGLYYKPCKPGYKGIGALCKKGWFRVYSRGIGWLSARELSTVAPYTQF